MPYTTPPENSKTFGIAEAIIGFIVCVVILSYIFSLLF